MKNEIKNAVITSADVRLERGCFVCVTLCFDYGGEGQCCSINFGNADRKIEPNYMAHYVAKICKLIGVVSVHDLEGKPCRVEATYSSINKIGHFLEDKWIDLQKVSLGGKEEKS